jgi:nucleotide-binding universal stress UspA family protein
VKGRFKRVLDSALKKARESFSGLKVSTRLGEGRVVDVIVGTAEEEGVDVIVMGCRGLSGIKELFLGSTSAGVVHQADCPVLIVK